MASSSRMRATKMPNAQRGVQPEEHGERQPDREGADHVAHDDAADVVRAGQDAGADDHVAHLDHLEGGVDEDADAAMVRTSRPASPKSTSRSRTRRRRAPRSRGRPDPGTREPPHPGHRAVDVAATDRATDESRRRAHQTDAADDEDALEGGDDLGRREGLVAELLEDDVVEERPDGPEELGDAEGQGQHEERHDDGPPLPHAVGQAPADDAPSAVGLHEQDERLGDRGDEGRPAGAGDAERRQRPEPDDEGVGDRRVRDDGHHRRDHRAGGPTRGAQHARGSR